MGLSDFFSYAKDTIQKTRKSEWKQNRRYYASIYEKSKIQKNTILIETRDGKSLTDSPFRIMLELLKRDEQRFSFVVVHEKNEDENFKSELNYWIRKENLSFSQISFVERNTKQYQEVLLSSEWIITNSTIVEHHVKPEGQKIINTWHGTPIKYMGFKIKNSLADSKNVLRNFLQSDYLISPSPFFTKVLAEDYRLRGLYRGEILEGGYPRNDVVDEKFRKDVEKILSETFGMKWDVTKKNLVYTPTWKGTNVNSSDSTTEMLYKEYERLHDELSDEYNVFVKVHPFDYKTASKDERLENVLLPDVMDANLLLSLTDLLITDYSSIFFDYLKLKKPLVFYAWDEDLYTEERGLYMDAKTLPGHIAHTMDELVQYVKASENWAEEFNQEIQNFQQNYLPKDDGMATERIVSYIFDGVPSEKLKIIKVDAPEKKKLLLYGGGMRPNGITTSLLNLLGNLDREKYDITLLSGMPNKFNRESLEQVPEEVRLLFRFGEGIYTLKEALKDRWAYKESTKTNKVIDAPFYQREVNRVLAKQEFDVAIDFSGYSFFFGKYILLANAKKKIVFQHNDILRDANREVSGMKPMLKDVLGLLDVYHKFDKIVSVSPSTMELNKNQLESLLDKKTQNKFTFATNTLNINYMLDKSEDMKNEEKQQVTPNIQLLGFSEKWEGKLSSDYPLSGKIQRRKYERSFIDVKEVTVFTQYEDIELKNGHSKRISGEEEVFVVADKTDGLNHWSKILVDGVYFGWVHTAFLKDTGLFVTEYQPMVKVGSILKDIYWNVWKINESLKESSEENPKVVAPDFHFMVSDIKGQYVRILGLARTNKGSYYHIRTMMNGFEVEGLLYHTAITRIHDLKTLNNPLWKKFENAAKDFTFNRPFIPTRYLDNCRNFCVEYHGQKVYRGLKERNSNLVGGVHYPIRKLYEEENGLLWGNVVVQGKNEGWIKIQSKKDLLNLFDIPNARFETRYKNVFPMLKSETEQFIREKGKVYFVTMARLSPEKNQKTLIQAVKDLHDEGIENIQLDILGQGPLWKELSTMIKDYGLQDSVRLLGQKPIPFDYIRERDVFILPSLWEGQPMVLLESLTLRVPTVASSISSSAYVLENHGKKYGLLSEGTDVQAIKDLIRKAMDKENFKGLDVFDPYTYNQQAMNEFENLL